MRSLAAPVVAVLNGQTVLMVQLVYLGFALPIGLNLSTYDIDFGGMTYKGAGAIGAVSEIDDSPGEIKGLSFSLAGVDPAYIALALDDAAVVQGTPCYIRTALLDANFQVVDAPLDWAGRLDTMSITEDGETCTISVTAESTAVDLLNGYPTTYSDADQRAIDPTDRAFEYLSGQIGQPVVWPTRQWFIDKGQR